MENYLNHGYMVKDLAKKYEALKLAGSTVNFKENEYSELIDYYRSVSKHDKALDVVKHAKVQLSPTINLALKEAQVLFGIGKKYRAISNLDKALELNPLHFELLIERAKMLKGIGQIQQAEDTLKLIPKDFINKKKQKNKSLFFQEKIHKIEKSYYLLSNLLLNGTPDDTNLKQFDLCLQFTGKFKEATQLYSEILDKAPFHSKVWYYLGKAYFELNKLKKAAEAFEFAFLIDETYIDAYLDYSHVAIKLNRYKKALITFEELLEVSEPSVNILRSIGYCYYKLNNSDLAKKYYKTALNLVPTDHTSLFLLSKSLYKEGNFIKATSYINQAIRVNKKSPKYFAMRSKIKFQNGAFNEALVDIQISTGLEPDDASLWMQYIAMLMAMNNNTEAFQVVNESLVYSENIELSYAKVALLMSTDNRKEAYVLLAACLEENYDKHDIIFELEPSLIENARIIEIIKMFK